MEHEDDAATSSPASGQKGMLIVGLAELPDNAILDQERLAEIFEKTPRTIRRMVDRHELPPGRTFGHQKVWTVRVILDHLNHDLDRLSVESRKHRLN